MKNLKELLEYIGHENLTTDDESIEVSVEKL